MTIKLLLSASKISQKTFEGNKPGYDSLQVDSFLDIIIKDYESMEKFIIEAEEENKNLNSKIDLLTKKLSEEEAKVSIYEQKVSGLENQEATVENIDLIKKIAKLEEALAKLGVNPSKFEEF